MKKISVFLLVTMFVFLLVACTNAEQPQKTEPDQVATYSGKTVEVENFSILIPDGWEYMEVDGGLQLYKSSGEIVEIHYRGFNQGESHARLQVENLAKNNNGTTPEEVRLLGKTLWRTEFTLADKPQVFCAAIEDGILKNGELKDGVMLSIKYTSNPASDGISPNDILETVVWK